MYSNSWFIEALVWMSCCLRLDVLAAGFPVVGCTKLATGCTKLANGCTKLATGCTKLATGFPNDWVDQTMSCQLIQTTSFAMHPRLIEYNAVSLDWMYKLPADMLTSSLLIPALAVLLIFYFFQTSMLTSSLLLPALVSAPAGSSSLSNNHICWSELASARLRTTDSTLDVSIANPAAVEMNKPNQLLNFNLNHRLDRPFGCSSSSSILESVH
ncbi:hypothetical protein F511_16991 [Dorcoceras hygrometricum]|uniref:Uncharacterized protein n=1 Tax=Dorcoceras hygrometricum TaxID=472368 RepID=A0A2Z7CQX2_9LAMI|nr:hypothetical protein F511_16991 [Dorcoceras hygrometricum]